MTETIQPTIIICPDGTILEEGKSKPVSKAPGCGLPSAMKSTAVSPYASDFQIPLSMRVNAKTRDDLMTMQRSCENWFIDEVGKLKLHSKDAPKREPREQLTGVQRAFGNMMAMSCVAPLRNGLKLSTITESTTMALTMAALDKKFRNQMLDKFDALNDERKKWLADAPERRLKRLKNGVEKKIAGYNNRISYGEELSDKDHKKLSEYKTFHEKLENIVKRDDPTRSLLSPRTAAMAQIGLDRHYYAGQIVAARNKDKEALEKNHREYVLNSNVLSHFMSEDGVTATDFHKERRQMVGELMVYDPAFGAMYDEIILFEGNIAQPEVPSYDSETGKLSWSGVFRNMDGHEMVRGSFHVTALKDIGNADKLRAHSVGFMENSLRDPKTRMEALTGYLMGSHANKTWDQHADSKTAVVPTFMAKGTVAQKSAIQRSRIIGGRCGAFGMNDDDREMFLWSSLCEATERTMENDPQFAREIKERFGERYRETFALVMGDPGKEFCDTLMRKVKEDNAARMSNQASVWNFPAATSDKTEILEIEA